MSNWPWFALLAILVAAVALQGWAIGSSNDGCRKRGGQVIESYGSNGFSWGCLEKSK